MKHDTHSSYNAPAVLAHLVTLGWDMDPNNSGLSAFIRYHDHLRNSNYPSMYIRGIRSVRYTKPDVARFVIACDHKDARRESAIRSHMIDVKLGTWEAKITRAVSSIAMSLYALSNKHMERDMKEAAVKKNMAESLSKALSPHGISEADFRKVFNPSWDWSTGDLKEVRLLSMAIPSNGKGLTQDTIDLYHHIHRWMQTRTPQR
jgi:hypothetical protein